MHSTCYLCCEQQFCPTSFCRAFLGSQSVSFNQLLTFFSQSLLFKCFVQLWAISHLQNWTFTFLALPLSLCLSFTIPLSCPFFFWVHPCLYCKRSTPRRCARGFTWVSLELKGVGVWLSKPPVASKVETKLSGKRGMSKE